VGVFGGGCLVGWFLWWGGRDIGGGDQINKGDTSGGSLSTLFRGFGEKYPIGPGLFIEQVPRAGKRIHPEKFPHIAREKRDSISARETLFMEKLEWNPSKRGESRGINGKGTGFQYQQDQGGKKTNRRTKSSYTEGEYGLLKLVSGLKGEGLRAYFCWQKVPKPMFRLAWEGWGRKPARSVLTLAPGTQLDTLKGGSTGNRLRMTRRSKIARGTAREKKGFGKKALTVV